LFDVVVVGSGPAGVFSAYQLRPCKVLMLDVGYEADSQRLPAENIYSMRKRGEDAFSVVLGDHFESLHNLDKEYMSPKLKGPLWAFLTRAPSCFPKDEVNSFDPVISFARGGLANAWGAGVLRFDDRDLTEFPITAAQLTPYYDELTRHIGINGDNDDLADYFGSLQDLHPPLPLSPLADDLLKRYHRKRSSLNARGFTIGRTRAAIITKNHRSRPAYEILNQDFFQPNLASIYHPGYTLSELLKDSFLEYRALRLVSRYEETERGVRVFATNLNTGEEEAFEARCLILAAGCINSARIVLQSRRDYQAQLPLLDNPVTFMPLINPTKIGNPLPVGSFAGGELIVVYDPGQGHERIQGSFYGLGAPLRTDLLAEFPLSMRGNLIATKYLIPGLAMLQIFYPDRAQTGNFLSLREDGSLKISYSQVASKAVESAFIRAMSRLGFFTLPFLCKRPKPGSSIHYAGSLPMEAMPTSPYQTDRTGKLNQTKGVFVSDGANFTRLPSKNHTFTIMANAMRIAEGIKFSLAS
jgi:choline dehydrogenase-like flavoprotein